MTPEQELEDLKAHLVKLDKAMTKAGRVLCPVVVGQKYYISIGQAHALVGRVQAVGELSFRLQEVATVRDHADVLGLITRGGLSGTSQHHPDTNVFWRQCVQIAEAFKVHEATRAPLSTGAVGPDLSQMSTEYLEATIEGQQRILSTIQRSIRDDHDAMSRATRLDAVLDDDIQAGRARVIDQPDDPVEENASD